MKSVTILRHSDWDGNNDILTYKGRKIVLAKKSGLVPFSTVVSSPLIRCQQTAKLLTGMKPVIDNRAGILKLTKGQQERIRKLRSTNPMGVIGVLFGMNEFLKPLGKIGVEMIELVTELMNKLKDNQYALIISHEGTMVAANLLLRQKPLKEPDFGFGPAEGFRVDERFQIL